MTDSRTAWPSVQPEVVAEVVAVLSARLQKRLDGAAAKLADRPPERTGDEWRIQVDEEVTLVLRAPGGVIRTAADVRCGCLLAPACLHRAAAVCAAPLAEAGPDTPPLPSTADEPSGTVQKTEVPPTAPLTPAEAEAVERLRHATAAALAAGIGGAGAVQQAELLRTGHQARLLGLHRPAALAATVVTRLRAARAAEPDHRLADLAAAYRDLLETTTTGTAEQLRGTARQTYQDAGALRLYGLCAEPVVTATHAGVAVWTVDADGRIATISDITPHTDPAEAARLAQAAAGRPVRLGDATLSHRELARAGLVLQGATRTVSSRLGAGAKVRAVRAAGADWHQPSIARLWAEPLTAQVERALKAERTTYELRPAGSDLLFLDITVLGPGPVPHGASRQLLADCAGLTVTLLPAHDHPKLAFRDNLALLAAAPGLRLRVIGSLERAAHPRIRLLAAGAAPEDTEQTLRLPIEYQGRINLGLERLQRADLPPDLSEPPLTTHGTPAAQPPVHLLTRRLEQVVTSGRRALTADLPHGLAGERQLRAAGLGTAAHLLTALRSAAADQNRDAFGRLRTDNHLGLASAWLAAACYQEELATALCATVWHESPEPA